MISCRVRAYYGGVPAQVIGRGTVHASFELEDDEYIHGIIARVGAGWDGVQFQTNKGLKPVFGMIPL